MTPAELAVDELPQRELTVPEYPPDADPETSEYEAFMQAANQSLRLLGDALPGGDREVPFTYCLRAVISLEVSGPLLDTGYSWADVVAIHVDDPEVAELVASALAGDADSVAELEDEALMWFDPVERTGLLATLEL